MMPANASTTDQEVEDRLRILWADSVTPAGPTEKFDHEERLEQWLQNRETP